MLGSLPTSEVDDAVSLHARIRELENELLSTKARLGGVEDAESNRHAGTVAAADGQAIPLLSASTQDSSVHNLMLLSDSALPLGSFAYSSGLESFLAHHKASGVKRTNLALFNDFLKLSIESMAYTNIPYTLAAYRDPIALAELDNDLDASTPCNVARRASVAQGRALLSVWEKAFLATTKKSLEPATAGQQAVTVLEQFARDLKICSIASTTSAIPALNGHFAPLWGTVCFCLGLSLSDSAYLFLLNHAKAVVSAAVRASVMGPYMAQTVLASRDLQDLIRACLARVWHLLPEDAGQVVPMLDLWIGRHELLYSRIFNS